MYEGEQRMIHDVNWGEGHVKSIFTIGSGAIYPSPLAVPLVEIRTKLIGFS
jgi:hypothetical protein